MLNSIGMLAGSDTLERGVIVMRGDSTGSGAQATGGPFTAGGGKVRKAPSRDPVTKVTGWLRKVRLL